MEQTAVIVVTAVLCAALYALFKYSKLGLAMQASSQNQLAAYYMGIPVKRLNVGGLVIGIVESLSGFYLPEGFKDIAAYIVVLIMLMVKPNGLFGEKLRKKV